MNGYEKMGPAAALLFVRSECDLPLALEQVNGLLAIRRGPTCHRRDDEVLAVCFRPELDSQLPSQPATGDSFSRGAEANGRWDALLRVQESLSLAGVWALSWLSGPALHPAGNSSERREALLRDLARGASERHSAGTFCPVFSQDQSAETIAAEMSRLKERHPRLIGRMVFRHDPELGVYCG